MIRGIAKSLLAKGRNKGSNRIAVGADGAFYEVGQADVVFSDSRTGRQKDDVEVEASKLRVGDVVSVEQTVISSEPGTVSAASFLIVGTVVNVNRQQKVFTVSKSEDDREVELDFAETRVFRLFHDENAAKTIESNQRKQNTRL